MVIIIPFYTNYKKDKVGETREKIRNITYKTLRSIFIKKFSFNISNNNITNVQN